MAGFGQGKPRLWLSGSELGLGWRAEGKGAVSADFTYFFAASQVLELAGSSGRPSFKLD